MLVKRVRLLAFYQGSGYLTQGVMHGEGISQRTQQQTRLSLAKAAEVPGVDRRYLRPCRDHLLFGLQWGFVPGFFYIMVQGMHQHTGNDASGKVEAAKDTTFERLFGLPGVIWSKIMHDYLGVGERLMVLNTDIKPMGQQQVKRSEEVLLPQLIEAALAIDAQNSNQSGDSRVMP